ncbi:MAG: serine/threonine-protein kinase [Vicinamibacterales bacterium]
MDPLTADRWTRIEALFSALVDAAAEERARILRETAATDPELAATVEGMLAHAGDGAKLRGVVDAAADALTAPVAALPARFGAFRVLREIGRGGMGVVYEGVSDDEFRRRVAIKVAPLARVGAAADARFRLERQILSSLEHPHIARFLDAGTEGDVPYLVMEFVEGVPITNYVASQALPLPKRLALVQKLCSALQYAHQRLVVHRDLKPTNILVTADGTPKLLDFGVAKLMDDADAPAPTLGALAWTPDYASPEQVTGELVGTPSDIYSLGLVLYEVLTGQRAQVADTTSPLALSRSVCEQDPPTPSARVEAAGDRVTARRLRGDLDTIVMTALHKDATRRYPSAAALSDDIARYLQGLPVEARAGSTWYRLRKTLARHRVVAVAGALVVVAVAGGLAATLYQARRADRRFQQVRALANEFVFGVHDRIETLPGSTEARRAIVQTALTYLENLREDASGDPGLARELAAAYAKVGRVQGHPLAANLGDPAAALTSYGRARDLLTPLEAAGDLDATLLLARVAKDLATVRRAGGDTAAMIAGYDRARALGERVERARPTDDAVSDLLGEIYADMARMANDRRDPAAAGDVARLAVRIAEAQVARQPADHRRRGNLATAQNGLGSALAAQGNVVDAAAAFRRAVEIREALVQEDPNDNETRRNLVVALGNIGDMLGARSGENLGDYAGAAAAFERAVAISREIAAADPKDRRAAFDLVNGLLRLGTVLNELTGRAADAEAAFLEADRVNAGLLAGEPGSARYLYLQTVLDRRLGRMLRLDGRAADAERRLIRVRRDAATLFEGPTGPNARMQHALAAVELAALYADTRDRRAPAAAATARTDVTATKMPALLEAQARADLGHALLVLARGGAAVAPALDELAASAKLWQAQMLPPALSAQRDRALAQVQADRTAVEALGRR